MSDTPTTNARWERLCCSGQSWYQIAEEMKLDCRQLERELTAARAELVEMTARAASLAAYLPPDTLCGDIQKCRDEYKMAIDQRDRLAEALKKAKPIVSRYPSGWDLSHDELDDADKEIDEALQSLTTNENRTMKQIVIEAINQKLRQ